MPEQKKRKSYKRYGGYWTMRDGKLYAVANIPLGNGKYQKKLKRVETKTEAKDWAIAQVGKARGGDPEPESKKKYLFYEYADWYKREFLVPPVYQNGKRVDGLRTYRQQQNTVDRLVKAFGSYDLKKITVDVLRRHKRARLKTVSITSINRDFAMLRTMFKKALRRKYIHENPFDFAEENLIETGLEAGRESPITRRIAVRLLARSRKSEQPLLFYLILVLMNTGARPSEIFPYDGSDPDVLREPLIWKNVLDSDFQSILLVSYKGKVRTERVVPTTAYLERHLRELHANTDPKPADMIFPFTTFKRSWATLCKSVGVKDVRIRDFRHYFNSLLVQNPDINDMERMLLLGHVKMSTNKRYSKLDDDFVRKYRDVIDRPVIDAGQSIH